MSFSSARGSPFQETHFFCLFGGRLFAGRSPLGFLSSRGGVFLASLPLVVFIVTLGLPDLLELELPGSTTSSSPLSTAICSSVIFWESKTEAL